MKWLIKLMLLLVVLAVFGVVFVLNPLLKKEAVAMVEEASGFPAEIDDLGLSLREGSVTIREFELQNPPGYPIRNALRVHEISAVPKVFSFLFMKPEFKSMVIDIPELNVVTRPDGQNNFKQLAENLKSYSKSFPKREDSDPDSSDPSSKGESRPVRIDRLELRLGKAVIYEYKDGLDEPSSVTLELGVERTYTDVEDLSEVMGDLFSTILQQKLGFIFRNEIGGFLKKLEEKNPETADDIRKAADRIGDQLKGLFESPQ